ncbi:hypothetical protein RhiirA5_441090 [Rhizophagus irregularis]|uniref:Uncharacterized protein n=1 Tax=Rhizophagus irregularis TaxID=588596 RepID=A0A2I1FNF1_9GLOM|nr:hypothetical protein RhiirA5_441090 [Rhizophagus irregularis]PKY35881.1 hypothetical protein RhiirB3_457430 [Rhizophagus irregularis]
MKIKLLIDILDSIDTNEQAFIVPPLLEEVNRTAIYKRNCYDYYNDFLLNMELLQKGKVVLFDYKDCMLYIDPQGEYFTVNSEEYNFLHNVRMLGAKLSEGRPDERIKTKLKLCGGIPGWIFDSEMTPEKIRKMIVAASESIDQCIIENPSLVLNFLTR